MKIKRKKQTWRRWGRLALGDLVTVVCLVIFFNVPCGLFRVSDEGLDAKLQNGDLALVLKIDQEYAPEDLVLFCANECSIVRILASNDEVKVRDNKLLVNGEEQMTVGDIENQIVVDWRIYGGLLVESKNGLMRIEQEEIVGKVILNIRVRDF